MAEDKRGKNVESRKNLEKSRKFSAEYQPTPEAKSKGKRRAKDFREMCLLYLELQDEETGEQNLAAIIRAQGQKAKKAIRQQQHSFVIRQGKSRLIKQRRRMQKATIL